MIENNDALRSLYSVLVSSKFKALRPAEFQTRSADFYDQKVNEQEVVIKSFGDNRFLFELELTAFETLKSSKRVCDIIFHSRLLPEYEDEDFKGPFFLVKPKFKQISTVTEERKSTEPLVWLERAAQQVEMASTFLYYGWRDMDGNLNNDVVTEGGKLIRFDLDSFMSFWFKPDKFGDMFHTNEDSKLLLEYNRLREGLFSEEAEVKSQVIRLSRYLLDEEKSPWELKNSICALTTSHSSSKAEEERYKTRWIEEWTNALVYSGEESPISNLYLSRAEARVLALLFFHILSRHSHGFKLNDLYMSLMLLELGCLKRRYESLQPESHEILYKKMAAQLNSLPEVNHFIQEPSSEPPPPPKHEKEATAPVAQYEILDFEKDGQAWAPDVKGVSHECEDKVLINIEKGMPILLLADGVSGGYGLRAVQVLQEQFDEWIKSLTPGKTESVKKQIMTLIESVHQRLLKIKQDEGLECSTTLVCMALLPDPFNPTLLIVRFGNSAYAVLHDKGGKVRFTLKSAGSTETNPLGTYSLDLNSFQKFEELRLTAEGTFHVRAFSDGVFLEKPEEAEGLLRKHLDIKSLVSDAAHWQEQLSQVGHDDWSIAGFDFVIKKKDVAMLGAGSDGEERDEILRSIKVLDRIDHTRIKFSEEALKVWTQLLSDDPELASLTEYPVINKVIKVTPKPKLSIWPIAKVDNQTQSEAIVKQETQPDAEPSASGLNNESVLSKLFTDGDIKPDYFVLGAIAVVILIIIFLLFQIVSSPQTETPRNPTANISAPPVPVQSPPPSRDWSKEQLNPGAAEIARLWETKEGYVLSGLPGGQEVIGEKFEKLITDLSELMGKTYARVIIEVHTDMSGKGSPEQVAQANLKTSENRGKALVDRLIRTKRVTLNQLQIVPKGDTSPAVSPEADENGRLRNRRIVIRLNNP